MSKRQRLSVCPVMFDYSDREIEYSTTNLVLCTSSTWYLLHCQEVVVARTRQLARLK